MRDVFEIISIQRSGHHAFIEWFCSGRQTPIVFYNHLKPRITARPNAVEYYDPGRKDVIKLIKKQTFNIATIGHEDDVIFNFEGAYPENIEKWNCQRFAKNNNVRLHKIVFLRDPLNTFASAAHRIERRAFRAELKFYHQLFCFVEIVDRLMKDEQGFCDDVILFSAWLTCPDYRRELGNRLLTSSTDIPRRVTAYGQGSSFNGMQFDPLADRSLLFRRWEGMKDNPYFLSVFLDRDIRTAFLNYFDLFSEFERFGSAEIDGIYDRAQKNDQAKAMYRSLVQPFRRYLPQLRAMNRDGISVVRNLRRSFLRFRLRGFVRAYSEDPIVS